MTQAQRLAEKQTVLRLVRDCQPVQPLVLKTLRLWDATLELLTAGELGLDMDLRVVRPSGKSLPPDERN
jgi:hypothetical protein